jgi:hypothetical protein
MKALQFFTNGIGKIIKITFLSLYIAVVLICAAVCIVGCSSEFSESIWPSSMPQSSREYAQTVDPNLIDEVMVSDGIPWLTVKKNKNLYEMLVLRHQQKLDRLTKEINDEKKFYAFASKSMTEQIEADIATMSEFIGPGGYLWGITGLLAGGLGGAGGIWSVLNKVRWKNSEVSTEANNKILALLKALGYSDNLANVLANAASADIVNEKNDNTAIALAQTIAASELAASKSIQT